jgi:hypothetical protein
MKDWGKIFKSCGNSGLFTAGSSTSFDEIGQTAVKSGLNYIYIDLIHVDDKQSFLKVLAEKIGFPSYFGMNWDALKDSLTDMPAGHGCVIALDNIRGYAQAEPDGMRTVRNIFKYTAGYWKKQAVAFYVLTRM